MPVSEAESKVCRSIVERRDRLLDDLQRLVALPTGGGDYGRVRSDVEQTRDLLTTRFAALGARTTMHPGDERPAWIYSGSSRSDHARQIPPTSVSSRLEREPGSPRVLIAGHLDTVHDPGGPFRELTIDEASGRAAGPGCIDMKGGLVIVAHALEVLEELGIGCNWSVLLNADEETGSYHSERAIREAARDHDIGIAVEPATEQNALVVERGGSGQFMFEVSGRSAHVGREFWSGVSAVNTLAGVIGDVASLSSREKDGSVFNIGPVEGGSATNAVPDRALAWGNVRFWTRDAAERAESALREIAERRSRPGLPRVEVRTSFVRAPKPREAGSDRFAALIRLAADDLGHELPIARTGGVCDGNILQHAGLPTMDTLGVRGAKMHTVEEWIELDALVSRCQLLALVLARLAAGGLERVKDQSVHQLFKELDT